jgi:hypothetical protein
MTFMIWVVFLLTKLSILTLYHRIMGQVHKSWMRWLIRSLFLLTAIQFIYGILITVLNCSPVESMYDIRIRPVHCLSKGVYWSSIAFHMAIDICLVTLPLRTALRLKISWRERLILACLFATGYL